MMKKMLIAAVFCTVLLVGMSDTVRAGGFGGEIGVYFPVGSGVSSSAPTAGYAMFTVDKVAQELTVEEKHGRLMMELRVTNEGDAPYVLEHRSGQLYDFILLDKRGNALWKWSDGMEFVQETSSAAIDPHSSVVYKAEIKRKEYKKLRDEAVLVTAFLTDTPFTISAGVPSAGRESGGSAVRGAIRIGIGNGGWYDY